MDTRENVKREVMQRLDRMGIPYHALEHPPILTVAEGKLIALRQGALCCKSLLLKSKRACYLLLLPADKKLQSKNLAGQIGSGHLSFASDEDLSMLLNTFSGAVSVLGLLYDQDRRVELLIDRDVIDAPYIDCHPCTNDCSLKIATRDLLERFLPGLGRTWKTVDL